MYVDDVGWSVSLDGYKNDECNEVEVPTTNICTSGWKYWDDQHQEWVDDDTLRIKCKGEYHN